MQRLFIKLYLVHNIINNTAIIILKKFQMMWLRKKLWKICLLKADSHMLRLTHEAAADGCVSAEIENFLFSALLTSARAACVKHSASVSALRQGLTYLNNLSTSTMKHFDNNSCLCSVWPALNLFGHLFMLLGKFWLLQMAKFWKISLAIWLHCLC